mgnify:CR=1 FL=1
MKLMRMKIVLMMLTKRLKSKARESSHPLKSSLKSINIKRVRMKSTKKMRRSMRKRRTMGVLILKILELRLREETNQ